MEQFEYSVITQVIGESDGSATYEVRKKLSIAGKRAIFIGLYREKGY